MHEQDRAARLRRIARAFLPHEQLYVAALAGPMLFAADGGAWRGRLVHAVAPIAMTMRAHCRFGGTRCSSWRRSRARRRTRPRSAEADGSAPATPGRTAAPRNIH